MSSNPNRPLLPADTLWEERAEFVGTCLGNITFGAALIIYVLTFNALIRKTGKALKDWFLLTFITTLFILALLYLAFDIRTQVISFVDNREFPGGPEAYEGAEYSTATWVIPNAAFVVAEWIADAFLLYRCVAIFRLHSVFVALPILIYLASIATGILVLFQASRPGASLWTKVSIDFGLPYFSLAAAFNIIVTILTAWRLLSYRWALVKVLGPEHASSVPYASIAAIFVESSMIYAVASLLFIGTYGGNSHASLLFLPILAGVQVISPTLIVYRIATMKAWNPETSQTEMTTIHFDARRAPGSSDEDTRGTVDNLGGGVVKEVHLLRTMSTSLGDKP
ncbi:hypothetical protein DENSPDRAFT_587890 [Dentipellis sp. KUC8613]|nr:hypothetical protein DENSPDRAFT_587890 [Dentipellis sp. KUC8613]